MTTQTFVFLYKGYYFPPDILGYSLVSHFSLSFSRIEGMMAQCGLALTGETLRQRCLKMWSDGYPRVQMLPHLI
jgi:hypothetical protein